MTRREIPNRAESITKYLLSSAHRFLGGIVVAVQGGNPKFTTLMIDDPSGLLASLDNGFGILTFDDTQRYIVLDGWHRLRAIKDAVERDLSLLQDDICVLLVIDDESAEGFVRTRRLRADLSRNAE